MCGHLEIQGSSSYKGSSFGSRQEFDRESQTLLVPYSRYEPAPHTDEVDEMWRTVFLALERVTPVHYSAVNMTHTGPKTCHLRLQRFPQHPQWCLVKENFCKAPFQLSLAE